MKKKIIWGIVCVILLALIGIGWQWYRDMSEDTTEKERCVGGKLQVLHCNYCDCIDMPMRCSWQNKQHPFTGSVIKCGNAEKADKIKNPREYKLRKIGEALTAGNCEKAAKLWKDNPADYLSTTVYSENRQLMPLLYYIIDYAEKCIPEVYSAKINVNAIKFNDKTPLQYAYGKNRKQATRMLLLQKKPLSEDDDEISTIVNDAFKNDDHEIIKWLVENGLPTDSQDKNGESLLERTIDMHSNHIAVALIKAGADVNAKAKNGESLLKYSIENNSANIAAVLIKNGADTDGISEKDLQFPISYIRAINHVKSKDFQDRIERLRNILQSQMQQKQEAKE